MSSQIKPINFWGLRGPNPNKVNIILEELDLPYQVTPIPLSDVKRPEYVVSSRCSPRRLREVRRRVGGALWRS